MKLRRVERPEPKPYRNPNGNPDSTQGDANRARLLMDGAQLIAMAGVRDWPDVLTEAERVHVAAHHPDADPAAVAEEVA